MSDQSDIKLLTMDNSNSPIMESKQTKGAVHFEDLWQIIGGFGRYPILLFIFMCYVTIVVDFQQFVPTYYGSAPNYDCVPWNGNGSVCKVKNKCECTNCTFVFDDEFTSVVSEVNIHSLTGDYCRVQTLKVCNIPSTYIALFSDKR